ELLEGLPPRPPPDPRPQGRADELLHQAHVARYCRALAPPAGTRAQRPAAVGRSRVKTVYYTASSLDGFIATEADDLSWLLRFSAEDPTYERFIARVGAVAMGKNTYLWLLNHHRATKGHAPFEWMYEQPSWVFSSTELERPVTGDLRFVRGDVRPVREEMAREAGGKDLWVLGGGDLVGQFHDHGLLDELIVTFAP